MHGMSKTGSCEIRKMAGGFECKEWRDSTWSGGGARRDVYGRCSEVIGFVILIGIQSSAVVMMIIMMVHLPDQRKTLKRV